MRKPSIHEPSLFYLIYQTTNIINGKIYVGKHRTRNIDDGYLGSGKLLQRAITKYGVENFNRQILFVFDNEEEMNTKERELVTESFCKRSDVYNICEGGKGGWSYVNRSGLNNAGKDKAAINEKLSNLLKGKPNPAFAERTRQRHKDGLVNYATRVGQTLSAEHRQAISEAGKRRTGINNSQFGTKWMNNGLRDVKVKKEDIEAYLAKGFSFGKIKLCIEFLICAQCGSEYENIIRKKSRKYCSVECRHRSQKNKEGLSKKELNTLSKRRERERKKNHPNGHKHT